LLCRFSFETNSNLCVVIVAADAWCVVGDVNAVERKSAAASATE
jgi:hypothetical protein